jgi:hypothetical protein
MNMDQQILSWIESLRSQPSDNLVHSLIEAGGAALPPVIAAWREEKNREIRNRLFEVIAEAGNATSAALCEEKLSSSDPEEVRLAGLGLLRFNPVRYLSKIMNAIQRHPALNNDRQFKDYVLDAINAAKRRGS